MLRASGRGALLAPVYLMILDTNKVADVSSHIRKGVGFNVKFELGEGRTEMGVVEFRRRLDDFFRQNSEVYETCAGGKILTHMHHEVTRTVHAYTKYIVSGKMRGGYIRVSKYGHKVAGHTGGKVRGGLRWAGDE
jgi:hypothetical protein